jgi:serine protease Do
MVPKVGGTRSFPKEKSMSDGSASQVPSKPRTGVLVASAAALALAVTGGVVAGFVWSGGGPAAVAERPAPQEKQIASITSIAAPAPIPLTTNTGQLPSLADIVERVSPAVVSLKAKVTASRDEDPPEADLDQLPPGLRDWFERFRRGGPNQPRRPRGEVQGSGFVIDPSGYIVTNNHVVANATEMEISFSDSKKYKAKLIGRDELTDIALIKIQSPTPLPSVTFVADDSKVRVGDWVLAVGNPFGLGGTVTAGIISARGRDEVSGAQFTDYLQIDAAINQGNSGGPTFDLSGRVIGMNTAIFSPSGGSVGIGFAIPSNTIRRVVDELKRSGSITRGWLGVQIRSLDEDFAQALGLPSTEGALVAEIIDGSPAAKAGVKQGDVVLVMNGATIKDNRDLSRRVAALQAGQSASFTLWRDFRKVNVNVTIAKRPGEERVAGRSLPGGGNDGAKDGASAEAKVAPLGLGLATITPTMRTEFDLDAKAKGVLITDVDVDSDAAERGLRPGYRIVAVAGKEVRGISDVKAAVDEAKAQKRPSVLLLVETERDRKVYVAVKLGK